METHRTVHVKRLYTTQHFYEAQNITFYSLEYIFDSIHMTLHCMCAYIMYYFQFNMVNYIISYITRIGYQQKTFPSRDIEQF